MFIHKISLEDLPSKYTMKTFCTVGVTNKKVIMKVYFTSFACIHAKKKNSISKVFCFEGERDLLKINYQAVGWKKSKVYLQCCHDKQGISKSPRLISVIKTELQTTLRKSCFKAQASITVNTFKNLAFYIPEILHSEVRDSQSILILEEHMLSRDVKNHCIWKKVKKLCSLFFVLKQSSSSHILAMHLSPKFSVC